MLARLEVVLPEVALHGTVCRVFLAYRAELHPRCCYSYYLVDVLGIVLTADAEAGAGAEAEAPYMSVFTAGILSAIYTYFR